MKHIGKFEFDPNIKVAINGMTFWIEDGWIWYSSSANSCPDRSISWKYPGEKEQVIDLLIKAHQATNPTVTEAQMLEALPKTILARIFCGYERGLKFINDSIDHTIRMMFKVVKWVLILILVLIILIFLAPLIHFLTSLNFGHPD